MSLYPHQSEIEGSGDGSVPADTISVQIHQGYLPHSVSLMQFFIQETVFPLMDHQVPGAAIEEWYKEKKDMI